MDYTEEPEEPTRHERQAAEAAEVARNNPIQIQGLTVEHIESVLEGIVEQTYGIRDHINRIVDKQIEKLVSALVDERIRARLDAKIDAIIEEGFAIYDYSGREKERMTVKGLVMKVLEEKHGDSFDRKPKQTTAELAVARAADKIFDDQLKGTIEQLKNDLRIQADSVFKAKIVEGMKGALGLR